MKSCGAPPAVLYATTQISGNTVIYTCDQGYTRKAGTPSTLTCVGYTWMYIALPACGKN